MLHYRELTIGEVERIAQIDATHYIQYVWRKNPATGVYERREINWTDRELPNGFDWHLHRLQRTLTDGGSAFGCFEGDTLVGYATVEGAVFGQREKYVLLDQLFVSQAYRGRGIGRALFTLCTQKARSAGGEKLYLCAGSAENTLRFYHRLGCVLAAEPDSALLAEDPNDIQLEYLLLNN